VRAYPCPMCLGALYYCSPNRVIYCTAREEYSRHYVDDRRYFSLLTFYDEYAKDPADRALPIHRIATPAAMTVYARWDELNSQAVG
jgi:guanine deaminase